MDISLKTLSQCHKATGSMNAAVILTMLMEMPWSTVGRHLKGDHWWYVTTQDDLAAMLGMSTQQVQRAITRLKGLDLVEVDCTVHPDKQHILRATWVRPINAYLVA